VLCQTDKQGMQRGLQQNPDDRQLYEMMRVGGGIAYRY
jgi:hypothetical protein